MKSLRKIAALPGVLLICGALTAFHALPAAAQSPPQNPQPGSDGSVSGTAAAGGATQDGKPAPPPPGQPAPQTPPKPSRQAAIVVSTSIVTVPVTVKDRAGRLVPDLHKDEFRIFEDNVEQKISNFSDSAFPISMVVLIDNDLKAKVADQVESSIQSIVAGMSVSDEASICRFDQVFHEGPGFTANQDKLLTQLKRLPLDDSKPNTIAAGSGSFGSPTINGQAAPGVNQPDAYGSTQIIQTQHTKALDDAVYNAAKLLEDRGHDRRKIILLISDGENGAKFNTNNYKTVVHELLRDNISVFSVGVGSATFDRKFLRLSEYAHASGGDIYYALRRNAMEELYGHITEEARHEYTLFYSPNGTDRGADYHTIEVRIEREGLNVTAREGYYTSGLQK
jgi:Ca-activated chloride channel homolog